MGRPKQLLPYEGRTLLEHVLHAAREAVPDRVVVVTGANADLVEETIADETIQVMRNADWQEGIASSIRVGVAAIQQLQPALDAVLFLVCDQPHVTGELLRDILQAHEASGKDIVACTYANTVGIPALFGNSFFPALLQLKGDEGAKKIILQNADGVVLVDFPHGETDIDTAADYAILNHKDLPPV